MTLRPSLATALPPLALALLVAVAPVAAQPPRRPGPLPRPDFQRPTEPRPFESRPAAPAAGGQRIEVPVADGHVLVASVARPPGAGPFPVVVVLHGSEGFRPHYLTIAQRFADAGYLTLAGAWFAGSHAAGGRGPSFQDAIPCPRCPEFQGATPAALTYTAALIDAARRLPGARADRVGLFGHSAGAGMAIQTAAGGGGVQAVVVTGAGFAGGPRGGRSLMDTARAFAAPLLILHGTADDQISVDGARAYERALRDLGKPVEAHYFEGGPHQIAFRPETEGRVQQLASAFFRAHLAGNATAAVPAAPAPATPAPRASATPARAEGAGYAGPIFDAHAHMIRPGVGALARPGGPVAPFEIVDRLRAAGVSGMFLFAAPAMVQRKYAGLVYAFVTAPHDPATQGPSFTAGTPALIEEKLRSEGARGIGELPLRHRPTSNAHAADGPVPMQIYEVAGRHRVPVTVHVEHEYSRELDRAVAANPKTVFIWAHVGSGPAPVARDLMRKFPNLNADVSTRNPIFRMGIPIEQNSLTTSDGRLKDEWRAAFEEFPDRFLLGLDINNTDRLQQLDELVVYYRSVLGQLTAAAAEKIAYRNAHRLLGLQSP